MVSDLWKACSDADLPKVQEILRDSSGLDIEAKGMDPSSIQCTLKRSCHNYMQTRIISIAALRITCLFTRPDATGATALVLAIRSGNVDIVKTIIDAGTHLFTADLGIEHGDP